MTERSLSSWWRPRKSIGDVTMVTTLPVHSLYSRHYFSDAEAYHNMLEQMEYGEGVDHELLGYCWYRGYLKPAKVPHEFKNECTQWFVLTGKTPTEHQPREVKQ